MDKQMFDELVSLIEEIDQLTDADEKYLRLDHVFMAASELKPMFQARIVDQLMGKSLVDFHKMTKKQVEDSIRQSVQSEQDNNIYFHSDRFNAAAMRDRVIEDYPPLWTLHDTLRIYNSETGCYETDDYGQIERTIRSELGERQRTHYVKETFDALLSWTLKPAQEKNDGLIPFHNGVLDFAASLERDDWVFHEHSPDNLLLSCFPVTWDPTAQCKRFFEWICEIVDEDDARIVLEMIGSIFHRGAPAMQSSFLLIGSGSNGKSLLLDLIVDLIGIQNVCANEWADYGSSQFATADLFDKALAMDTDLQNDKPIQSAVKKAITGDWMSGQFKYKDAFNFLPVATWIGAANELPKSKDKTYGFFRRWIPVAFPNTFDKNPKFERELKAACLSAEGKSGIVNYALTQYRKAFRKDSFSVSEKSFGLNEKLQSTANTVKAWVDAKCVLDADRFIPRSEAYPSYQRWITDTGLSDPVGLITFNNALRSMGCSIDDSDRRRVEGKQVKVISGLDFK